MAVKCGGLEVRGPDSAIFLFRPYRPRRPPSGKMNWLVRWPRLTHSGKGFGPMTLKPYDPQMLDQFALRLLDLAATLRQMAHRSRESPVGDFALHDKKAYEWIGNLERWARKSLADLEMRALEARARQRAMSHPE